MLGNFPQISGNFLIQIKLGFLIFEESFKTQTWEGEKKTIQEMTALQDIQKTKVLKVIRL